MNEDTLTSCTVILTFVWQFVVATSYPNRAKSAWRQSAAAAFRGTSRAPHRVLGYVEGLSLQ